MTVRERLGTNRQNMTVKIPFPKIRGFSPIMKGLNRQLFFILSIALTGVIASTSSAQIKKPQKNIAPLLVTRQVLSDYVEDRLSQLEGKEKLTAEQAEELRFIRENRDSPQRLADFYGMTIKDAAAATTSVPKVGGPPPSSVEPRPVTRFPSKSDKARRAFLRLESEPIGAEIFVDGWFTGKTPLYLNLPLGKHQVRLTLPGYHEWETQVELSKEGEVSLPVRLLPVVVKPESEAIQLKETPFIGSSASQEQSIKEEKPGSMREPARLADHYTINLGSFREKGRADRFVAILKRRGFEAFRWEIDISGRGKWHRVSIGSFPTRKDAEDYVTKEGLRATFEVFITRLPNT